jgi:hypothetical protein
MDAVWRAWADAGRKRAQVLGHHRDRNSGQFSDLHNCTVPLGDATRRPTPDAELPALSAGVVRKVERDRRVLTAVCGHDQPGARPLVDASIMISSGPGWCSQVEMGHVTGALGGHRRFEVGGEADEDSASATGQRAWDRYRHGTAFARCCAPAFIARSADPALELSVRQGADQPELVIRQRV